MSADALARVQEASIARASEGTRAAFPPERRMDGETLVAFLREHRWGVLATVKPDGRPHAATVGFALAGERFVVPSRADAARVRNLRHEPHASLVVSDGERPDAVVMVEGTCRLVPPMETPLEVREPFRAPDGSLPPWIEVMVVMTPERLLSHRRG